MQLMRLVNTRLLSAGRVEMKGKLDKAEGFRLRLRRAPELHFRLDRAEQEKARVEELLNRSKKRSKSRGLPPAGKPKAAKKKKS
jgi:hypothetical protein